MDFDYFYNRQAETYNFIRLPMVLMEDEIFKNISLEAKVLYSYMLNRMGLSYKNGWIDETGKVYIYYTIESVKEQFNCANDKATKIMNELDIKAGIGLIEKKRQGLGKPNKIYVKDFMSIFTDPKNRNVDIRKEELQTSDNQNSRDPINRGQDFRKIEPNYNNINNIELSKNDFNKRKNSYGIYQNIFLSKLEYDDLVKELGSKLDEYINRLSTYMKANNRTYEDHKATLLNWYLNDKSKNQTSDRKYKNINYDKGESLWQI